MTHNPAENRENNPMEVSAAANAGVVEWWPSRDIEKLRVKASRWRDAILKGPVGSAYQINRIPPLLTHPAPNPPVSDHEGAENRDYVVGIDLTSPGSDRSVRMIAKVGDRPGTGFDVQITRFDDGHEIAMPKRMTPEDAAWYAATNDLF